MNILYIHPAGTFGGASKSLVELFLVLKQHQVTGYVITPKGSSAKAFAKSGMHTIETLGLTQFDNTRFGYYRKWRWLILIREVFFLPFSIIALIRAKRLDIQFDLIHVNEITLLPVAVIAKWIFRIPMVMHIRSLQRENKSAIRSRVIYYLLQRFSSAVICIDKTVEFSLPGELRSDVVHNSIDIRNVSSESNSYIPRKITVGIVGVLLRAKGVYEFVKAAKILIYDRKLDIKFILIGENARVTNALIGWIYKKLGFSEDVAAELKAYIEVNKLEQNVILKGFVGDTEEIYSNIDVLCFPSHLNACGRPVFEAAFYAIPSIVAIRNPLEDAIIHKVTGLAIDRPDEILLADAIEYLVNNHEQRLLLGQQARNWADTHFSIYANVDKIRQIYQRVINRTN